MKNKTDPAYSKRLLEYRHSLGLSQVALANMLGITQGHYSKIETGKIGISYKNQSIVDEKLGIPPRKESIAETELEKTVLHAMRTSPEFSDLVGAALKCIK
jgi:transcriptional regulator with XRE-family HTH domain